MVLPDPDTAAAAADARPDVKTVPVPVFAICRPPRSPAMARVPALQQNETRHEGRCSNNMLQLLLLVQSVEAASLEMQSVCMTVRLSNCEYKSFYYKDKKPWTHPQPSS